MPRRTAPGGVHLGARGCYDRAVSDLPVPVPAPGGPRLPAVVAPPADAPGFSALFAFMRDAELRFESLRMRIEDRTWTARGEETETLEIWLRHPGRAKVLSRSGGDSQLAGSHVWVADCGHVRTYDARANATTARPVRERPQGITDGGLPSFARVYVPRTMLPMETLADTFVHPHGFCRNVLLTGELTLLGTTRLRDREAWLLRCDHPRRTEVLTDRPERTIDVAVDRLSGLILLLVEHVADTVTRNAAVTDLQLDAPLGDDAFVLHVPEDARALY